MAGATHSAAQAPVSGAAGSTHHHAHHHHSSASSAQQAAAAAAAAAQDTMSVLLVTAGYDQYVRYPLSLCFVHSHAVCRLPDPSPAPSASGKHGVVFVPARSPRTTQPSIRWPSALISTGLRSEGMERSVCMIAPQASHRLQAGHMPDRVALAGTFPWWRQLLIRAM